MVSWKKKGKWKEIRFFTCFQMRVLNLSYCGDKDERGEKIEDEFFFSSEINRKKNAN